MSKFFDIKLIKFVLVGIANTLFSAVIMFLLYNLMHFGYWGSSAISYVLGSILSFFLNKNFTFQNKESIWITALKFSITVAICYVIAYSIAQPIVTMLLKNLQLSKSWIEQISMLFGMGLFTLLNYVGQRFFAFKEKKAK
jgi:putative flippase GtrA